MPIIIFAQPEDSVQPQPQQPAAPSPTPTPTPTAPVAEAPKPTAPPLVTQQQPKTQDLVASYAQTPGPEREAIKQRIFSIPEKERTEGLSAAYKAGYHDEVLQLVYDMPKEDFGTVGNWLVAVLKRHWENPQQEAQLIIYEALKNWSPGGLDFMKYMGLLRFKYKYRNEQGVIGQGESRNLLEAAHVLEPYIVYLSNPEDAGAKKIDDDIMQNFQTDDDRVWEQYKRDAWRDMDENGPGRVDRAKQWFVEQLRQQGTAGSAGVSQKDVEHVVKDETIELARKVLPVSQQYDAAKLKSRLLYLKKPNINRRKVYVPTKALSDPAWMQVADLWLRENGINDAQKYNDNLVDFDDWLIKRLKDAKTTGADVPDALFMPQMNANWFRNAERTLIANGVAPVWRDKKSPYWLNAEMIDPSAGGISKNYVPHVKELMGKGVNLNSVNDEGKSYELSPDMVTKRDEKSPEQAFQETGVAPTDAETFMGTMQPGSKESLERAKQYIKPNHPQFKDAVKFITRNLYSPYSPGLDDANQRTQAVLSEIGRFYSNMRYSDDPATMPQARALNDQNHADTFKRVQSLLEEPLALKHVQDEYGLLPQQRFGLALREFMMDVFEWLAQPQNQSSLQQVLGVDAAKVAAIKTMIRMAAFVYSAKARV